MVEILVRVHPDHRTSLLKLSGHVGALGSTQLFIRDVWRDDAPHAEKVKRLRTDDLGRARQLAAQIPGSLGLVRLDEGLGVRYPPASEPAAWKVVGANDDRFNEHNLELVPTEYWEIQNLPLQTKAPAVFEILKGFGWTTLPIRWYERGDRLFWIVGTTTPSPQGSGVLVGAGQRKLVCNKLPDQERSKKPETRRKRATRWRSLSVRSSADAPGPSVGRTVGTRSPSAPPKPDRANAESAKKSDADLLHDPWAAAAAAKFGSRNAGDQSLQDTVTGLSTTVQVMQEAQRSAERRLQSVEQSSASTRLQVQKLAKDMSDVQASTQEVKAGLRGLSQQVTTSDSGYEARMMACLTNAVQQGILAGGSGAGAPPGHSPG